MAYGWYVHIYDISTAPLSCQFCLQIAIPKFLVIFSKYSSFSLSYLYDQFMVTATRSPAIAEGPRDAGVPSLKSLASPVTRI